MYASFFLTAIENMAVDFGVAYFLPVTTDSNSQFGQKVTILAPVQIGLGYRFTPPGNFQFRARLGTSFAGSMKPEEGGTFDYPFSLGLNILPMYNLGFMRVFFNAGIGLAAVSDWKKVPPNGRYPITAHNETRNWPASAPVRGDADASTMRGFAINEENALVSWYINPYIDKSIGQGRVWCGFKLWSDGIKGQDSKNPDNITVNWSIPIGIQFNF